jgi:N-acetylglutamate synthase-like GNAT family acetyltransferase
MANTESDAQDDTIRPCDSCDIPAILRIINRAAEPYMRLSELKSEITDGVTFSGFMSRGELIGVMGIQRVRNVRLIRHAYVLPDWQGHGIGSRLIVHLLGEGGGPVLIGTWAAATWAIRFYRGHGFDLVPENMIAPLLRTYWNVPERQIAASMVLAGPSLTDGDVARLIAVFG